MNVFDKEIKKTTGSHLRNKDIETIQVNVGLMCNLYCSHCHLEASPSRMEKMSWPVMQKIIDAASTFKCTLVDITGGSPELNDNILEFIDILHKKGRQTQIRTNLIALFESENKEIPEFLREREVRLVGSLPCYLEENVDAQRGKKTYNRTIKAIKKLNELGYGKEPNLVLDLVHNPVSPSLPPNQSELENAYKSELDKIFGITFSKLLTITNMPIGRFQTYLQKNKKDIEYRELLRNSFNPATIDNLMCRNQVSIGWNGTLYDCDFNLALDLPIKYDARENIQGFDYKKLKGREIVTGEHCFGCTAGAGSSCGGAILKG